ncbi:MAG: acetyl-CoA hydrolase/transferase family protein [Candidatus Rokubacteria bacterium]|nr:acetyl-CoA hydrolase/transferase family protein [Candidatus Rokubacteria bacterium]
MGRPFEKLTLAEAVGRLRPGMKLLLPPGCGEPVAFIGELCRQADRLAPLTLMGGLLLGNYPFCRPEHGGQIKWVTWQLMPPAVAAWERGQVEFVPARYFDTVALFGRGGPWAPDAVVVHTTPPDRFGYLSLGVSVSYPLPAAREAPMVIAQVNPQMPRTLGNAFLHRSQINCWVEAEHPLVEYPPSPLGEVERQIGRRVSALIPDGATIQIGVGAIPQAVMEALADKRNLGVHSIVVDHMLPLIHTGVITNLRKSFHPGRMDLCEVMGTRQLLDFVHDNPLINMEPSDVVHDPQVVARIANFVSINSALEVDLTGQVNAESLGPRQLAGIGGQVDFVLGAWRAAGGRAIIALQSTGRGGSVSRIVPRLREGTSVTTPRYLADYVVTEYGVAELKGKSLAARARALIAVAHPSFREELERNLGVTSS